MSNLLKGKLYKILPVQTGTGKNGTWTKQDFIIETDDQYPKKVLFSAWGDKATDFDRYKVGDKLTVSFNAESREYNEKWYTELRAWKIEGGSGASSKPETNDELPGDVSTFTATSSDDQDLPF
jgi:hypothetical protein